MDPLRPVFVLMTMARAITLLAAALLLFIQPVHTAGPPWPDVAGHFEIQPLAANVYAVVRKDAPGFAFESNSLVVVGDSGVLVVDAQSNLTTTRRVLDAIRALTPKPVTYLVNTHAHDDHVTGNQVYLDAFPALRIIAHREGREDMATGAVTRRKQFQESLPRTLAFFRGMLDKNAGFDGAPLTAEERDAFASDVAIAEGYTTLPAGFTPTLPMVTFEDRLTLHLDDREIQVVRLGRGHSMGDCVVLLPREGILATGDLVVAPIPLVGTLSWPVDYASTMEKLLALGARTFVPGHGPVLRDDAHVRTIARLLTTIRDGTRAAIARGDSLEATRKGIDLEPFRAALAGDSKLRRQLFDQYVAGPAVARAFEQLKMP